MSDKYDSDGLQFDQFEREDNPNGKKRFVWPESLHKDFIAAVFDIGMIHGKITHKSNFWDTSM